MARLYPYIFSDDCKKQADFYCQALGGEIILMKTFADMPGNTAEQLNDKILHLRPRPHLRVRA